MNSLNILSGRSPTPPASRSRRSSAVNNSRDSKGGLQEYEKGQILDSTERDEDPSNMDYSETSPLLGQNPEMFGDMKSSGDWRALPKRISTAVIGTVRVVIATVAMPAQYVIACFYNDDGQFSAILPLITIYRALSPRRRKRNAQVLESGSEKQSRRSKTRSQKRTKRSPSMESTATAVTSDSELDEKLPGEGNILARNARSRSTPFDGDEIAPQRRSIRIKLHNEEALKKRRKQQEEAKSKTFADNDKDAMAAALKSPSSPGSTKITRFPRAPLPPRPLVPRRQPSYSKTLMNGPPRQKTLIIDLDETLIHSHSKGGRFATGHMVEVKIQNSVGLGGVAYGPQVPILYYVHKRPHCDEFLRKVPALRAGAILH